MMQAPQTPAPAPLPTLEQSFELLKEFKVGTDSTVLIPIERAVMEVHGNETARAALEKRLVAYLGRSYSSVTRAFVCRQLVLIGSAASVSAVTPLILDDELSVHARNVLEHIPGPESEKALRDALGQAKGRTRIGVINSVAARRDAASTPVLIKILGEDPQSAAAAAKAAAGSGTVLEVERQDDVAVGQRVGVIGGPDIPQPAIALRQGEQDPAGPAAA